MPTSTDVTTLKINTLTKAQYETAVQGGVIGANELSILTDVDEAIQVDTMPTAAAGEVGKVYQFIGTTDANYTHGYFYECVSDGQPTPTYSWSQVNVQPAPSGLPSQTGNSGKFLTTDGTDASWSDKVLTNRANTNTPHSLAIGSPTYQFDYCVLVGLTATTNNWYAVVVGYGASTTNGYSVAVGYEATATSSSVAIGYQARTQWGANADYHAIAIGYQAVAISKYTIQIGKGTNSTQGTFSVGLEGGNYRMLDTDGTIPTDRFTTTPVADGTYVPTLSISSGTATRSWTTPASAPVVPATAPTLAVADWSSNTQTITVSGVTSSNVVLVGPAPSSAQDYADAGIICTAQGTDSLTFTCTTVPSNAITLSVVIFG